MRKMISFAVFALLRHDAWHVESLKVEWWYAAKLPVNSSSPRVATAVCRSSWAAVQPSYYSRPTLDALSINSSYTI